MRIHALSDLHVAIEQNRQLVQTLPAHPADWLILAGDLGETVEHLEFVLRTLTPRFARVFWVPGNHELWSKSNDTLVGVAKYESLVARCRQYGVATPEDPWPRIPGEDNLVLACMFLLYDYSFAPAGKTPAQAVQWAADDGILCADEVRLLPDPFPSREAWCAARVAQTRQRLEALPSHTRTILVNHWPLRTDLCRLRRIPRFIPWCGTRQTERWHVEFNAQLVISGHLHMRATDYRDGVRFEEVSLGYPSQYSAARGAAYLRCVWPPTQAAPARDAGPYWHP